jgi:hypothetical protein
MRAAKKQKNVASGQQIAQSYAAGMRAKLHYASHVIAVTRTSRVPISGSVNARPLADPLSKGRRQILCRRCKFSEKVR